MSLLNGDGSFQGRAQTWGTWAAVLVALGLGLNANWRSDQGQVGAALKEVTQTMAKLQTDQAINAHSIAELQAQRLVTDQAISTISSQMSNFALTMQKIVDQLDVLQTGNPNGRPRPR